MEYQIQRREQMLAGYLLCWPSLLKKRLKDEEKAVKKRWMDEKKVRICDVLRPSLPGEREVCG